ncbi:MAG: putative Ribosomal small subunit methyltransferase [Candidatus Saccharibacteria bacterium]|nr:putative Ribosomal small subunit methyltransferase [Candidatus Saccharibacteria bacterium]
MNTPIAKKSLGQHWLKDHDSLQAMVTAGEVQTGDEVLEIGPGYGTLTEYLLAAGAQVRALEFDDSLVPGLLAQFAHVPELKVEQGDIRTFDFTSMPPDYKIVANIPYYLTSNLIQLISETPNQPAVAVLLMQKEVAERVVAQPGSMSILSITAQFYWEVSLDRMVGAELFSPPPKVDSQILVLKRRVQPLFADTDSKQFFRLVKAGFSQKRKTLLNSLSGGLAISKDEARVLLERAAVDPGRRAQTLSLQEWHQLLQAQ